MWLINDVTISLIETIILFDDEYFRISFFDRLANFIQSIHCIIDYL